jgi:hypothetical protein
MFEARLVEVVDRGGEKTGRSWEDMSASYGF